MFNEEIFLNFEWTQSDAILHFSIRTEMEEQGKCILDVNCTYMRMSHDSVAVIWGAAQFNIFVEVKENGGLTAITHLEYTSIRLA